MSRFACVLLLVTLSALADDDTTPYAGQQEREIKSMSPQKVESLLAGSGMGYAKAAELNHYPGPLHVLELNEELGLDQEQVQQTHAIHVVMQRTAIELGRQLLERERVLDQRFANGSITPETLRELVAEIARLEGEIRTVHLRAHLDQWHILSAEQVQRYDELRGYTSNGHQRHGH